MKEKNLSRTSRMWLTVKWGARWARLMIAWYCCGAFGVATVVAVILGNWWIVPIYLFLLDVASGRIEASERSLDHSGFEMNVPGMNALRTKLRAYHDWTARQKDKEQGNGEARQAS